MKHVFPTLYAMNKQGVWKEWKIQMEQTTDHRIVLHTQHGQHGGKMITDIQPILTLKRGYQDLWEQAMSTAQSKWNHKQQREGYQTTMNEKKEGNNVKIRPMLAKTFNNGKHLVFPLYVQPKLDGLRCLAQWNDEQVVLYSRTGCPFLGLDPIRHDLATYLQANPTLVVDGELYSTQMSFEELSGYCRRKKSIPNDQHVLYHVFDVIVRDKGFHDRMTFFPPETQHVRRVSTQEISTMDQVKEYLMLFITQGYEGLILRNRQGIYRDGHRSHDLQKYKLFQEEEFLITGYTQGTGREQGLVIWQCETKEGKTFHVRPKGDYEMRKKLFQEAEQLIGKKVTVLFQEYTNDHVPRFPVAKAIRDHY